MIKEYSFRGSSFRISCTERHAYDASWFSFEDESSVRERWWSPGPGDAIVDVGAAFGSYTLTALARGASRSYAWSPRPNDSVMEPVRFRESLELNGWADRCEVYESGIWSKDGWLSEADQSFSADRRPDTIPVSRLDSWYRGKEDELRGFARHWLKLDVEGAEVEVLRSGESLLRELRPIVLVENHLFKDKDLASEVRSYLESLGFRHVGTEPHHSVSHSFYEP